MRSKGQDVPHREKEDIRFCNQALGQEDGGSASDDGAVRDFFVPKRGESDIRRLARTRAKASFH
jgi:hypothetical protein